MHGGEKIDVHPQERPPLRAQAESIPLDILYEDADIIAVNKPAGMTVHAGAGNASGTLVNALLGRGQTLSQFGDALRPGIVHRLDKETSGVILVAKTDAAHARLGEAFRQRTVNKTYIALVQGSFDATAAGASSWPSAAIRCGGCAWPRSKKPGTAQKSAILARRAPIGARCCALTRPLLLEVQLHTGRTHQIRVHFSALKHPVVGDTLYGAAAHLRVGGFDMPSGLGRNFLHAAQIIFSHPRTGEKVELRAPLPVELREFLYLAGEGRRRRAGKN